MTRWGAAAGFIVLSVLGCASAPTAALRRELANQGPVALSEKNPFVASNLLLSKEIEASPTLKGFIQHRGTPSAIEVTKNFYSPYRFTFYYLQDNESYVLELKHDDWLIFGPSSVATPVLAPAKESAAPAPQAALLETPPTTGTVPAAGKAEIPAAAKTKANPAPEQPSYQDFRKQTLKDVPPRRTIVPKSLPPAAKPATPEPLPATASESGDEDVLHKVSYPRETLRIIAEWYTGDAENATRIARINSIENPNVLTLGQSIRIPRYLLKTSAPLTMQEIERYWNSVGEGGKK